MAVIVSREIMVKQIRKKKKVMKKKLRDLSHPPKENATYT